jgi:hypothetical protein
VKVYCFYVCRSLDSDCGYFDACNVICGFYYMTFNNIVKFRIATTGDYNENIHFHKRVRFTLWTLYAENTKYGAVITLHTVSNSGGIRWGVACPVSDVT